MLYGLTAFNYLAISDDGYILSHSFGGILFTQLGNLCPEKRLVTIHQIGMGWICGMLWRLLIIALVICYAACAIAEPSTVLNAWLGQAAVATRHLMICLFQRRKVIVMHSFFLEE